MQLDRQTIHWDNIGLGLQQLPGSSVRAKTRVDFETISRQSRQTTACTIPKCTNPIWSKETIRIEGTTVRQQSQALYPTGMRQFLFLSIAVDSTLFAQTAPSITIIQTKCRHNATNTTAP
jgi:hypothetical protein